MIFDAHPKEFISVKPQQTVLDKCIGIDCAVQMYRYRLRCTKKKKNA